MYLTAAHGTSYTNGALTVPAAAFGQHSSGTPLKPGSYRAGITFTDGANYFDYREKCYAIIECFTEEQLSNIEALLMSAKALADESADDIYSLRLYADYQADTDKGDPVSIESFAKELGISL